MVMASKQTLNFMKHPFDSIIFDLDGTLWDATATVTQAYQAAQAQVDYLTQEAVSLAAVQAVTGQPYQVAYDRLFPTLPAEHLAEFRALCARQELAAAQQHGGRLYPGLAETIRNLAARYRLFIVSNCQVGYIEAFFRHSGLELYFGGHQCFGTKMQPKFQNILDIIAQYGLKAPVYVGDTYSDFEASQKSGIPFIFAAYGFGNVPAAEAPTWIDQVTDLQKLL